MDAAELKEVLRNHRWWVEDVNTGQRANLSGADLRDADLRDANLRDADLRDADLRDASLSGASLSDAEGFLLLPAQDSRGYSWPHAVLHDQWMIRAGCRFFTIEQAREHWGNNYQGDREIGDMYLNAVDWLELKIGGMEVAP